MHRKTPIVAVAVALLLAATPALGFKTDYPIEFKDADGTMTVCDGPSYLGDTAVVMTPASFNKLTVVCDSVSPKGDSVGPLPDSLAKLEGEAWAERGLCSTGTSLPPYPCMSGGGSGYGENWLFPSVVDLTGEFAARPYQDACNTDPILLVGCHVASGWHGLAEEIVACSSAAFVMTAPNAPLPVTSEVCA